MEPWCWLPAGGRGGGSPEHSMTTPTDKDHSCLRPTPDCSRMARPGLIEATLKQ